jgi:hypothetical protein
MATEQRLFRLNSLSATAARDALKPYLTPNQGRIEIGGDGDSVSVVDTPEVLRKVSEELNRLDS